MLAQAFAHAAAIGGRDEVSSRGEIGVGTDTHITETYDDPTN
eukprot:COSAG02_NODE_29803_length_562_cov_1.388769_2_plen_41_part_01